MKTIILLTVLVATGCCSVCEPEMKPLPPEKLKDLRFIDDGWVYKSITIKDYIGEDYNQWSYLNLYDGIDVTR
jgi:hypothetical protein